MDFARRQLEKYGWSDGKGLGKHENGISEALKPKLKRSVTGIGHDAAAEFNEHWWSALYDKAAKNVEVEEKNGKTKKIKTVHPEEFTITNSTWRINKKHTNVSDDSEYSEYFVRKAVLTNEGTKVENVTSSESEDEGRSKKDVLKMTDEELFAACEGRTAHKGARHGLKALGKLARIAQQEQILLTQSKYEGYSHAKKLKNKNEEIVEDISLDDHEEKPKNKKKKKRKHCFSNGNTDICEQAETELPFADNSEENLKIESDGDTIKIKGDDGGRKLKKSKKRGLESELNADSNGIIEKTKKKKKRLIELTEIETSENKFTDNVIVEEFTQIPKKKKKKKTTMAKE